MTSRRLAAASVLGLLVVGALVVGGMSTALADLVAVPVPTAGWEPQPPIDPSGIAYANGRLFVVDCNIDELDNYQGVNLWQYSIASGQVVDTGNTHSAAEYQSFEPTGAAFDPDGEILYVSEDSSNTVWGLSSGPDQEFGTADDVLVHEFDIGAMGAWDTEDPAWDPVTGHLFVLNGGGSQIFEVDPDTGQKVGQIDLPDIIANAPGDFEGLARDPVTGHLFAGARVERIIYEVTTEGAYIGQIDASVIDGLTYISGLTMAPSPTSTGGWNMWITDRGSDSLFELSFDGTTSTTTTTTPTSTTSGPGTSTTTQATSTTSVPGTTTTTRPDPSPDPEDPFVDDDGHIFENAIEWIASEKITQGCNPPRNDRYCPGDYVTRGQMAAFLVRALGYQDDQGGHWFDDDDGNVFENAIDRLATAGVTQGCNPPRNDRYCPDDYVTRGQMAAFLKRALDG